MLGALGGGGGNQTNITNNFNLKNYMAQQKQCMRPMDYRQLEYAVNELKGPVQEIFDFASEMEGKGVKCPENLGGGNNQCERGEKSGSNSSDWFIAIASALAKVIKKQATKVKTQSDTVSNLPDKQKQEDADAANKGSQESSQASSGTDASTNTNGTSSTDNELQKEMTMLKAESQKLEFLTTAVKTTLDKISGLLDQLGRAG